MWNAGTIEYSTVSFEIPSELALSVNAIVCPSTFDFLLFQILSLHGHGLDESDVDDELG
jgi:hypothetical protein